MGIVQAFSVRLVHLGFAKERKQSANVWHGITLEKMMSPIWKEKRHTGEDPESQFKQRFSGFAHSFNRQGAISLKGGHVLFSLDCVCDWVCVRVLQNRAKSTTQTGFRKWFHQPSFFCRSEESGSASNGPVWTGESDVDHWSVLLGTLLLTHGIASNRTFGLNF